MFGREENRDVDRQNYDDGDDDDNNYSGRVGMAIDVHKTGPSNCTHTLPLYVFASRAPMQKTKTRMTALTKRKIMKTRAVAQRAP